MSLFSFAETVALSEEERAELFVYKEIKNPIKKTVAVVDESHYAIFIKDGVYVDSLPEGRHTLTSGNESAQSLKLIYASKAGKVNIKWATPVKFDVGSGESSHKVAMRGEFEVQIGELRKAYCELNPESDYSDEKLRLKLRNRLLSELQPIVAKITEENGFSILNNADELAISIEPAVADFLIKDYGLRLVLFALEAVTVE